MEKITTEDVWEEKVSGYVRLFKYILVVSKEIGEEKAWKFLENIVKKKRFCWLKENKDKLNFKGTPVEQAYRIFYLDYLKINPNDVKIIEKSKNKIITRWRNPCPVLKACKILGLDTRKICKKAYDDSAQAFISKIDPKLKFKRNYNKIRPYFDYCEETIELSD